MGKTLVVISRVTRVSERSDGRGLATLKGLFIKPAGATEVAEWLARMKTEGGSLFLFYPG
jgi:hypothetical protein